MVFCFGRKAGRILNQRLDVNCLAKLLSGRWIITVVAAVVFGRLAWTGQMPAEDVKMILGIVITFYFTRERTEVAPK